MSTAIRYTKPGNTGDKLELLLEAIRDPRVSQVLLYATSKTADEGYSDLDGADSNLPEVAALVIGTTVGNAPIEVVFDGALLTAARYPRYREVRDLLDEAEKAGKVFFLGKRVPFTSSLTPENAASTMKAAGELTALTPQTRPRYFSMLSSVTEAEYALRE